MRKIIGATFVSLDGVMQAPGGPTEDPTGGFDKGGWLAGLFDQETGEAIDKAFQEPFDLLLGRRTYDIFAGYWPFAEGDNKPMGELFDRIGKYVLTRSDAPLQWQNSHRVASMDALAELKRSDGPNLVIQGSSTLYPQLLAARLIDRMTLMTFRVVLGQGKRLFGEGTPARMMKTVEQKVTAAGNIIATYEPGEEVETGTFASEQPSPAELRRREQMQQGQW